MNPTRAEGHASRARQRGWLDRVGAGGSLLCAIHCAIGPLILAMLPAIGAAAWFDDRVEGGFVAFVSMLGLTSLGLGYRRHRAVHALGLMLLGLAILWCGILVPALHHVLVRHAVTMAIGGMLVAVAHVLNLRLNHVHVHGAHCTH